MHIEFSIYVPQLLLIALVIYLCVGVITFVSHMVIVVKSDNHELTFDSEVFILFFIEVLLWPFTIKWFIELYQENKIQRLSQSKRSYFLSEENNHVRNGGELDFYH